MAAKWTVQQRKRQSQFMKRNLAERKRQHTGSNGATHGMTGTAGNNRMRVSEAVKQIDEVVSMLTFVRDVMCRIGAGSFTLSERQ